LPAPCSSGCLIIGIIAYLRALLDAVVAIVVTVFLVKYVRDQAGAFGDHG